LNELTKEELYELIALLQSFVDDEPNTDWEPTLAKLKYQYELMLAKEKHCP